MMIKEKYQLSVEETSLSLVQSRLDSVRKKSITRTGYRVYRDGLIGVYGQLGQDLPAAWDQALDHLEKNRVAYPFEPAGQLQRSRTVPSELDDNQIMHELETALEKARNRHPEFILSNKVNVTQTTTILENDRDTHLYFSDKVLNVAVLLKHRESVNIMDAFLSYRSRHWDPDYFAGELDRIISAYNIRVPFPDEELLVITEADLLAGKLVSELNGEKVGFKSSLLTRDFGHPVFHDHFTFYLDWDETEQYNLPFFDAEGTVMAAGRVDLIRKGVVEKAYTDKRTADRFQIPLTGSAFSPYDGVPTLGARNFNINRSEKTLKQLMDGRLGVIVVIASGGDYTDEGKFATPVQLGLLTDGEKLLGRLPEFNLTGDLYDLFGKDYIGYSSDRFLFGEHALVVKMKLAKS